jgi:hypothetical protein
LTAIKNKLMIKTIVLSCGKIIVAVTSSEERCSELRLTLEAERNRLAEEAAGAAQSRLEADKERCRASALDSALAAERLQMYMLRANLEGEAARHRATRAALDGLRAPNRPPSPPPVPQEMQVSAALRHAHLLLSQVPLPNLKVN